MADYQTIIDLIDEIRDYQEEQDTQTDNREKLQDQLEGLDDDIAGLEKVIATKRKELQELIDEATLAGEPEHVKPYRL